MMTENESRQEFAEGCLGKSDGFAVAVVGGGPAGLTAAVALGSQGVRTALVASRKPYGDNRTTALLGASVDLLDKLGVWQGCARDAAPLRVMRLVDDTNRLIRSPEVRFDAAEIGRDAFGWNIENRHLVAALEARLTELPDIERIDADATAIAPGDHAITLTLSNGRELRAPLVVGADGRNSLCREAAGIAVERIAYPQSAVTFNVTHSRPHGDISTEFHTEHGPCVVVPLPGLRSSIVCVTSTEEAKRIAAMDRDARSREIERRTHNILGRMDVEDGCHVFPLARELPLAVAARRIALIGEAAHVVPPIGAQGLNLGLRDAGDLARVIAEAIALGRDPGDERVLSAYASARSFDIRSRAAVIDLANRTLLSDVMPIHALRAAGLHLLAGFAPLRRLAMREGLGPDLR